MHAAMPGSLETVEPRHVPGDLYERALFGDAFWPSGFITCGLNQRSKTAFGTVGSLPLKQIAHGNAGYCLCVSRNVIQADGQNGKPRASFDLQRRRMLDTGAACNEDRYEVR